jgi:hypothetical protein
MGQPMIMTFDIDHRRSERINIFNWVRTIPALIIDGSDDDEEFDDAMNYS